MLSFKQALNFMRQMRNADCEAAFTVSLNRDQKWLLLSALHVYSTVNKLYVSSTLWTSMPVSCAERIKNNRSITYYYVLFLMRSAHEKCDV